MQKKTKKIISLVSAFCCAAGSFAMFSSVFGGAESTLPVYADGDELFKTEFYLGAWCEPNGTDEAFERYKEVGFNVVYLMNEVPYNSSVLDHYLKMGEKHGIKMIIANGANRSSPTSLRYQTAYSLADYPAF